LLSQETSGGDYWYDFGSQLDSAGVGQMGFSSIGNSAVHLVDAATGVAVSGFNPTVSPATESGGVDSSAYQGLLQVDLGGFPVAGVYRLQVDGLGASFPF